MKCVICGDYRQFLLDNGVKPFSFRDAGEPGYMQPSSTVVDRHRLGGCEPIFDGGEWNTACDFWVSQELHQRESEITQNVVSEYALKAWMREHGREPDPLSGDIVEEYLGEWLMKARDADSERFADQEDEAA